MTPRDGRQAPATGATHVALHADALSVLGSWRPPSDVQATLRRRFVDHLVSHPDGTARTCRPGHLTASVLVLDQARSRLLLTLHAKAGRWFQLGGHPEPGDLTLAGAALREAAEESGLLPGDLDLDPVPVALDAHHVPFCGRGGTTHLDVMFRATARDGVRHVVSEESLDLAWWPVGQLPDPELEPMVALALARAQSTSSAGEDARAPADQPNR